MPITHLHRDEVFGRVYPLEPTGVVADQVANLVSVRDILAARQSGHGAPSRRRKVPVVLVPDALLAIWAL